MVRLLFYFALSGANEQMPAYALSLGRAMAQAQMGDCADMGRRVLRPYEDNNTG